MIRPADLCHQWCHKFIVLVSLVKLLHTVKSATVKAFDAGIGFGNVCRNFINNLISKSGISAQRRKVFANIPVHLNQFRIDRFQCAGAGIVDDGDDFIELSRFRG